MGRIKQAVGLFPGALLRVRVKGQGSVGLSVVDIHEAKLSTLLGLFLLFKVAASGRETMPRLNVID